MIRTRKNKKGGNIYKQNSNEEDGKGKDHEEAASMMMTSSSSSGTLGAATKRTATRTTAISSKDKQQRSYTVKLYSLTTILLFADQNLLAPNLSAAAAEFGFDNDEKDQKLGGDIALAFFLLGAPASFLVGCAADSDSDLALRRSTLFGLMVIIGEGACFMTYFTSSYTGLYVTRALTGFSIGGALPLLSSVLGDWFPPDERSGVMASVGVGTGIGTALGQSVAGFMGARGYGWRVPFLVVSVPALIVGLIAMFTVRDPVRGGSEVVLASHQKYYLQKRNVDDNDANTNGDSDDNDDGGDQNGMTSLVDKDKKEDMAYLEIISSRDEMESSNKSSLSNYGDHQTHGYGFSFARYKSCFLSFLNPSTYSTL